MKVEYKTLILKLHYFLHGAGAAPLNPYLVIIIKQLGMNIASMGPIIVIIQLLGLLFKPIFGSFMDRCRNKSFVFQIAIAGTLIYYGLNVIPPNGTFQEVFNLNVECKGEDTLRALHTEEVVSDLCIKHKFNSIYRNKDIECFFHCVEANDRGFRFRGHFRGEKVDLVHKGHLRVFLERKLIGRSCHAIKKCSAMCPKFPEVHHVLNNYITEWRYLIVVIIWIIGNVSFSVVNSLQDAVCQKICRNLVHSSQPNECKSYYGQQRVWSCFGYGISAILMGHIMDTYNKNNLIYDYSPVFNLILGLWTLDLLLIGFLKVPEDDVTHLRSDINSNRHQLPAVWSIISRNQSVILFLFYVTSVGFCYGAMHVQMIFLEDLGQRTDCNGSLAMKTLGGAVLLLHTLGEIPIFLYSHKLLEKIGAVGMMNIVLIAFSLRFLYYSQIESPWSILLVELSNGLTTGLFWPAISYYAVSIAPEKSSATMLSVTYAIFETCGVASGGLLATKLYGVLGGKILFSLYGLFAVFVFFLHHLVQTRIGVKDLSYPKKHAQDEEQLLT